MTKTGQDIPRDSDERYIAGDTAVLEIDVVDDDGNPKDLTNADVAFALAEYAGDMPLVEKTDDDSDVQVTDPLNGKIEIIVRPGDTDTLGSRNGTTYYYEVATRDASGDEATVTTGDWTVYADTATF